MTPEVGVFADNERLECVEGLRLNPPSWGSKSETVELMLGLLLNVDENNLLPLLLLLLLFLALWYLMAAMAQTSKASALSLSGVQIVVNTCKMYFNWSGQLWEESFKMRVLAASLSWVLKLFLLATPKLAL